jgi:aryl-alcohol dehydrogenase-like predicted oxidoreductase
MNSGATSPDRNLAGRAGTLQVGDLTVNRIGYGAMHLCAAPAWGAPKDPAHVRRVLARALELGINFIDTADSYGPETSESMISDALHPYPAGLVIATKGGFLRPDRYSWVEDARPAHLRKALEGSLRRLKLDCIDLYQLHAPDPKVPFAESVGALAELQRAGKIRHIGISNVTVAELEEARRIVSIVSVQNEYNVSNRSSENVLEICERLGIAFLPYFPLGNRSCLRAAKVKRIASRLKVSPAEVALAWLLAHSKVTLPIPGTQSAEHLEENTRAAVLRLGPQDLRSLD